MVVDKPRNLILDRMKGITILLVVLYHAIGNNTDAVANLDNGLFLVIASFFMQAFMIISGYLSYGKAQDGTWVQRHVVKWIVPLVVFMVVYWVWHELFPDFISLYDLPFLTYVSNNVLTGFTGVVLWYVWCLMLCYLCAFAVEYIRKWVPLPVAVLLSLVALNLISVQHFGLLYVKWYGIFFFIGYLVKHYERYLINVRHLALVSLIGFPLLAWGLDWMLPWQNLDYGYIGTAAVFQGLMNGYGSLIGVMFLMAVAGSAFVYSLAWTLRWRVLSYLGSVSVGIFLLHVMFVGIIRDYLLATVVATAISFALYEGYRRIRRVPFLSDRRGV